MPVAQTNPQASAQPNAALPPAMIHNEYAGFSLIFISILLTVAALIFVAFLPGKDAGDTNQKMIRNVNKLERVEEAMRSFMAANGRRPCPADGQYVENSPNFGVEAANPGSCNGGAPAAPLGPDAGTGHVVGGVIPTKTLSLPDELQYDEWGRRFTYVVDVRATSNSTCVALQNYPTNNGLGGIKLEDTNGGTVLANVMYAYISHGPSGYGAFPAQGSTVAGRINTRSSNTDMQVNAGVNSSFAYSAANFTRVKIQNSKVPPLGGDTGFDDTTWVRHDIQNICCLGPTCGCTMNWVTGGSTLVPSGQSVVAYEWASGATCPSQIRICNAGTLSGSYAYNTCTATAGASCTLTCADTGSDDATQWRQSAHLGK